MASSSVLPAGATWCHPSFWARHPLVRHVVAPCWWRRGHLGAWVAGAVLLAQSIGVTWLQTEFGTWAKNLYDATVARDAAALKQLVLYVLFLSLMISLAGVLSLLVNNWLSFKWRALATERVLSIWLGHRNYYHLERLATVDNPDQRIESDIRAFIDETLMLVMLSVGSVASAVTFSVLVWQKSGGTDFSIGDWQFSVPGYMFWLAWLWALVQTGVVHLTGRALVGSTFENERANAEFRYGLTLVRQSAEEIALYRGEEAERDRLSGLFGQVRLRWRQFTLITARSSFSNSIFGQLGVALPTVLTIPPILAGTMNYGQSLEVTTNFLQLLSALLWLANSYPQWAGWAGTGRRLTDLLQHVDANAARTTGIETGPHPDALRLLDLRLSLPQGQPLLGPLSLSLAPGARCLITGPSGAGKSSLLRAIAGLWVDGTGRVECPPQWRVLFLPQQTYIPPGSLKDVLCYPGKATEHGDDACLAALQTCRLPMPADALHAPADWGLRLSPGERQRIAFARALLQRPDLLFLDETTSAVDEPTEAALYEAITRQLPQAVIVSVGHRSTLRPFHDRHLDLGPAGAGDGAHRPPDHPAHLPWTSLT